MGRASGSEKPPKPELGAAGQEAAAAAQEDILLLAVKNMERDEEGVWNAGLLLPARGRGSVMWPSAPSDGLWPPHSANCRHIGAGCGTLPELDGLPASDRTVL